jgi:hypothetical protein
MTAMAYFADLADGTVLEFRNRREPTYVDRMGCQRYREVPARVNYFRYLGDEKDHLYGYHDVHGAVRITRKVAMKSQPTLHDCDARCMNATGRDMACECACGGRNHGKGRVSFLCEA